MKQLLWATMLVLCSLPIVACQAQDTETAEQGVDRIELERSAVAAFKAYASLLRESKFTESIDYYADDPRFVWVEDGAIKYDKKAQIKRALEGITQQGVVVSNFGLPTVWALNDTQVMVFAKFRTTVGKGSADEFTFAGAITAVMENRAEGWQFISGHTSSAPAGNGF
ncbi:MAG: nuclear transport factor 2 family protein [Bacteroidota bacterium]